MKKFEIKNIISEIIYESLIGKNPFKVGDLVKLHPEVLKRHSSSIPAHAGFTKNQFAWRETLNKLEDKEGKITKIFPNSKNVNVQYPESWTSRDEYGKSYTVNTINISYMDLVPADNPETELGEVSRKDLKQSLPSRPSQYKYDDGGNLRLDKMTLDNLNALLAKVERAIIYLKSQPEPNPQEMTREVAEFKRISQEIKRRMDYINDDPVEEGVGWGDPKKIAKDRLHTTNKTTGKVQRWTTKFKGRHEKEESVKINEIKKITNEILDEMWTAWEEGKDIDPDVILKKKVSESDDIKSSATGAPPEKNYIIWAKSGPSTVYYINSPTQGERMVQNAPSMAYKFHSEEEVRNKIIQLQAKYKGILKWDIKRVGGGDDGYTPKHKISAPVKIEGEWVVKWMTDGKRDENKTYYTDDREDAVNTYIEMLNHANELNKQS